MDASPVLPPKAKVAWSEEKHRAFTQSSCGHDDIFSPVKHECRSRLFPRVPTAITSLPGPSTVGQMERSRTQSPVALPA